jgi:hypothetical protein
MLTPFWQKMAIFLRSSYDFTFSAKGSFISSQTGIF